MEIRYCVRCQLTSTLYCWANVDNVFFDIMYQDHRYHMKRFKRVCDGFVYDYYTFFKQRSNGLAVPNSYVRFLLIYSCS